MDSKSIKSFVMCVIWGIVWGAILYGCAILIVQNSNEKLADVLFIEGVISIMFGLFSCVGGNSIGLSIQGLGQNNAQYIGSSNLSISKMEKEKFKNNVKITVSTSLSMVSFIVAGIICIGINFIV
ncbi:hypothetical protein [Clostridium sp. Ade.TY]|uniref:hypothetical protein n=1 Tax=Clostridium sp. Ade.TY TaxID=1391647 RepID=UPI0004021E0D|nr:hypothetical protein [Clostridium sp. Ade.TY]